MALSNYDTLAFDDAGHPCSGILSIDSNEHDIGVQIYKNWLYVRDSRIWNEGARYIKPTVAEIHSGTVMLSNFEIEAIRGPQNSVFALVTATFPKEQGSKEYMHRKMAGIGCYGYEDQLTSFRRMFKEEYAAIPKWLWKYYEGSGSLFSNGEEFSTITFWDVPLSHFRQLSLPLHSRMTDSTRITSTDRVSFQIQVPGYTDVRFVGVRKPTLNAFEKWLRKTDEEYARKIDFGNALRYNQGDSFILRSVGLSTKSTPIGEHTKPILETILK